MLQNRSVFQRDPTTFTIPNDGVAEVGAPESPEQWNVLRYELESFVCEGEYRDGLERILTAYLAHLDRDKQPAVWVSGFYGSGKSHLVRVLEYLWRDVEFPDGVGARGLVHLPAELDALLKELTTAGRRHGGLWSAAGVLGSTAKSIRLGLLSILFQSAGLPSNYAHARFVIWLKKQGIYDAVAAQVAARGEDFDEELRNLYVSPILAESLYTAYPGLVTSPAELPKLLIAQFPQVDEIDDSQFLSTVDDVLHLMTERPGKRPCTLIVLDELQASLGESSDRTIQLQNIVEACSSRFGSTLLFVGTGQAALEATTQLSKLQDRFTVRVMLEDKDVVRVVREVILRKAPAARAELARVLDQASGEIDRHLPGTKIAPIPADKQQVVDDYPLLPVRRRFWDRVLRTIDSAGTSGQLRNQLRLTHEATRLVGHLPLGHVIPADFIYDQQESIMLQRKVLLPEVAATIQQMRDGTTGGELRARLCATIFLIGELPSAGVLATGIRATADTLADLLVEDLPAGSSGLRQQIPPLLQQLVEAGTLMEVEGEYRLQTREGAEWERDFRARYARIAADDQRLASDRLAAFQKAVTDALKILRLVQGASRTPRKFTLEFNSQAPTVAGAAVPVWVRDEWNTSLRAVREEAQAAGVESPLVFVFLPRQEADALNAALAAYAAATETLNARPVNPGQTEAYTARQAMETRQRLETSRVHALITGILRNARVFQGGGNEVVGDTLAQAVESAVQAALVRMFPNFALADHADWGKVVRRASQGAPDALSALGYDGEVGQHPVCREVRAFIGAHRRGSEIQAHFRGPGYGWQDDAINGAIFVLMAADMVKARRNHQPVPVKELVPTQVGITDFYGEEILITALQRIRVRSLLADLGFPAKPNEEAAALPKVLQHLIDLAADAGGPPPLPPPPDTTPLTAVRDQVGNAQFVAVFEARDQLLACDKAWRQAKALKAERLPRWQLLERLLHHAEGLEDAAQVRHQVEAIRHQRTLLVEPDPTRPLIDTLAAALRTALQSARQQLIEVRDREVQALEATEEWNKLGDATWRQILHANQLGPVEPLHVETEERLLATLDEKPLATWQNYTLAVPARIQTAREEAARQLEPKAVRVHFKPTTLRNQAEVEEYLQELRAQIMAHLDQGQPVIL